MRNSTIICLLAASALSASAAAPLSLTQAETTRQNKRVENTDIRKNRIETRKAMKANRKANRKAPVRNVITPPSADDKIIPEPEGTQEMYVKSGIGWSYNWFYGLSSQNAAGSVSYIVKSADEKTWYISNPFSEYPVEGWLEGTVDNGVLSLKLPQLVNIEVYEDEDTGEVIEEYLDYCLAFEYKETEDGAWYYPTEAQEFKFNIHADGTLVPVDPNLLLGQAAWFEEDPEEGLPAEYSWQGNGNLFEALTPNSAVALEAPETLEWEDWNLIDEEGFGRRVQVAFDGNDCWLKRICNLSGLYGAVIKGTVNGDKVTFPDGQYFGVAEDYLCTAWFRSGEMKLIEDPDGDYMSFSATKELVLDYDAAKKVLSTDKAAYCLSTSDKVIFYFKRVENPYIAAPNPNAVIEKLREPIFYAFWEADPDYDEPAELMFDIQNTDADNNVLDTSKLYYNIFLDGELYEFYTDQYEDLTEDMTDVPYGFESDDNFFGDGDSQDLYILSSGFESLGFRTVYKDGDKVIYSGIVYVPMAAVKGIAADANVLESSYIDFQGRTIANPDHGFVIRKDRLSDGSVRYVKVVK